MNVLNSMPEPLLSIFIFAAGLALGSFLNVCIYRMPTGKSVVTPGSRCPGCGVAIRWYQNIPVLSWLLLAAKCANCRCAISWRYPMIELFSGGLVLASWLFFGASVEFLIATPFTLGLLVLFFTDFDQQLLPDAITITGLAAGLAAAWFNPFLGPVEGWPRLIAAISGAALGAGVLWGIGALYEKIRGVEAMGMGDVKMMGMVGALTGPSGVFFTIFGASLVGAAWGLLMIPLRGRSLQDTLPFGCFLAPASLAALLIGRQAVEAYFQILVPGP